MAALGTGRRIREEATTEESEWCEWLVTLKPEALTLDEIVDTGQRLVVVSPHPDDEVLACGGLIALHAARGGDVAVIAVTDGEASHRGDPGWSPESLAVRRRGERQLGLWRLGLTNDSVSELALSDGEVTTQRSALERGLYQRLRRTDCVVTTWRLDGHPDHDTTGAVTARLCDDIGCRLLEAPVWMWQWSTPGDARVPWPRLRPLPLPTAFRARKEAALAEHQTQLAARGCDKPVLGSAILARAARGSEYFFV